MEKYIGTKIVDAEPQDCPKDDQMNKKDDKGYKVVYPGGYVSWSPKKVFDDAYRKSGGLTFGFAIELLKKGARLARDAWNGKGMYLVFIPAGNAQYLGYDMQDCVGIKNAQNVMQPGWHPTQKDMLADDWVLVE